jgi:AraC-like DNA-binding protein
MNNIKTLSYLNVASMAKEVSREADILHYVVDHPCLGKMESRHVSNHHVDIIEFKTDTLEDVRVQYDEKQMLHSLNVCFALEGTVGLDLKESKFSTTLSTHQHHHIFAPEPEYDIQATKKVHGFHLSIDLDYFANLMCEKDAYTARVKDKLLRKEKVWAGKAAMHVSMKQALQDLMNNPLTGKFKSLFVEAKVLELVALQLNQFAETPQPCKKKKQESDIFYDLRQYLQQNFTADLSLKGLSRTFGMNEFKLKKGFKEFFDTTIFDYIHDLKMLHAQELLRDHKLYVNEVSSRVGYKNPNHFSTAFKRKFGISPATLK